MPGRRADQSFPHGLNQLGRSELERCQRPFRTRESDGAFTGGSKHCRQGGGLPRAVTLGFVENRRGFGREAKEHVECLGGQSQVLTLPLKMLKLASEALWGHTQQGAPYRRKMRGD